MPPDASRLAANVVRMLCSASGPSGSSSTCGRAPLCAPGRRRSGRAAPRTRRRSGATVVERITLRQRRLRRGSGYSLTPVSAVRRCAMSSAAPVAHLGDLLGDEVAGRDEAALRLDLLEVLPRLVGELLGEVLDEPGAARRVEHPTEVRLLQQQQLGVAGDAAGETRCGTGQSAGDRRVERQHRARCRHRRPRRRTRRAWCAACSPTGRAGPSSARGDRVHAWRRRPRARRPPRRPAPTAGAAARNLAMVMNWSSSAANRKLICRNASDTLTPGLAEQPQIGDAGGDGAGQLPRRAGARGRGRPGRRR